MGSPEKRTPTPSTRGTLEPIVGSIRRPPRKGNVMSAFFKLIKGWGLPPSARVRSSKEPHSFRAPWPTSYSLARDPKTALELYRKGVKAVSRPAKDHPIPDLLVGSEDAAVIPPVRMSEMPSEQA